MPDSQTSQPTILIKKPDGTSVRMTLDELKKMRSGAQKTSVATPTSQIEENVVVKEVQTDEQIETEIKTNTNTESVLISHPEFQSQSESYSHKEPLSAVALAEAEPHELATTTPVTDIFIHEAQAQSAWNTEDHRSPLEEDMAEIDTFKNQGHAHTTAQVKLDNSASIASQISKELMPRFNALVLSYKKGVRSDPQFIEYVLRDTAHGGLGFSTEQMAHRLLEEVQQKTQVLHKATPSPSIVATASRPPASPTSHVMPSATNTQKQTEYKITPSPSVVHDMVQPMTQQTTGPEDEIANFSLRDFRRLSKDPRVASEMLYEKFDGWKKDSFILYMKTLTAWKASPLYTQYIALTLSALTQHTQINTILDREQQRDGMNTQEYVELVALHGRLVV